MNEKKLRIVMFLKNDYMIVALASVEVPVSDLSLGSKEFTNKYVEPTVAKIQHAYANRLKDATVFIS